MNFKWSERKKKTFEYKYKLFDHDTFDREVSETIDILEKAVEDKSYDQVQDAYDGSKEVDRRLNEADFEYSFYHDYLEGDAPNSDGSITKACHKYFFEDESLLRGKFSEKLNDIKETLTNSTKLIKEIEDTKKNTDKWFSKSDTRLKSIITKIGRYDVDLSKDKEAYDSAVNNFETDNKFGDKKVKMQKSSVYAHLAGSLQTLLKKESTLVTNLISGQMEAAKFHIKQCRRVWLQAVNFSGKKESAEEMEWLEYIGEAADIDTDSLFEH